MLISKRLRFGLLTTCTLLIFLFNLRSDPGQQGGPAVPLENTVSFQHINSSTDVPTEIPTETVLPTGEPSREQETQSDGDDISRRLEVGARQQKPSADQLPVPNGEIPVPSGDIPIPSQKWISIQMDKAYAALNSDYTPPSNYTAVVQPQTYYCPHINVFFTAIPKNGCTNWKTAMLRAEGIIGAKQEKIIARDPEWIHDMVSHPYRMPQYRRSWNTTFDERIKSARSVLVLRNPWVRAVSAYRQKLSGETKGWALDYIGRIIINKVRGKGTQISDGDTPTFEEYMTYVVRKGGINEKHFNHQWKYISPNLIRYDHVIPLELAGQMAGPLFSELGIDHDVLRGAYDQSTDPRLASSVVKAREYLGALPAELVEGFYKIYKIDFMLLNYSNFTDPEFPLPVGYY
eukprot:sb/3465319/